ncbi:hypothetical protein LCGC14_2798570, partial [marine sediment metagenome]
MSKIGMQIALQKNEPALHHNHIHEEM